MVSSISAEKQCLYGGIKAEGSNVGYSAQIKGLATVRGIYLGQRDIYSGKPRQRDESNARHFVRQKPLDMVIKIKCT